MDITTNNKNAIEYYRSINLLVKEFCKPLSNRGVTLFVYFKVHMDGSYVFISNDMCITESYCSKITNDNMQDYIKLLLENNNKDTLALWPSYATTPGLHVFFDKYYWHGLTHAKVNEDNVECCSFLGHKDNHGIADLYLRHHETLVEVSKHFKRNFSDIISKSEHCKARFQKGYNFDMPNHIIEDSFKTKELLQEMGIDSNNITLGNEIFNISQKQLKCLELFSKGYLQKEIGQALSMDPNTVQTHIHRIKEKTGIYRKSDLIKLYNDLFKR